MSTLAIAAVTIGSIFVYLLIAGATSALVTVDTRSIWKDEIQFFAGALWPIALPALLGSRAVHWIDAWRERRRLSKAKVVRSVFTRNGVKETRE